MRATAFAGLFFDYRIAWIPLRTGIRLSVVAFRFGAERQAKERVPRCAQRVAGVKAPKSLKVN